MLRYLGGSRRIRSAVAGSSRSSVRRAACFSAADAVSATTGCSDEGSAPLVGPAANAFGADAAGRAVANPYKYSASDLLTTNRFPRTAPGRRIVTPATIPR